MRRSLKWILGATAALSAWALLYPARAPVEAASVPSRVGIPASGGAVAAARRDEVDVPAVAALPTHWPRVELEAASRNPFFVPPASAPKTVAPPPPPPPSSPVVDLPPANYRFWGRMTAPDGHRLLMLARGDAGAPVAVDASTKLEDGWAVESIGDNGVVLLHAASQRRERIPIPAEAQDAPG
jgi:hypothetical protein